MGFNQQFGKQKTCLNVCKNNFRFLVVVMKMTMKYSAIRLALKGNNL